MAYASYSGNTAVAARNLAQALRSKGLEARELELVTKHRLSPGGGALRALLGLGAELSPSLLEENWNEYEVVFLATPVWSFSALPQINTFVHKLENLEKKKIFALVTCYFWYGGDVSQIENRVKKKGGELNSALSLSLPTGFNDKAKKQLIKWLDMLEVHFLPRE